ncbi:MAG: tRNA pseudouridine synthase A [Candidatus Hodarchaeales archaeon]|jgi:tRNA pseudouridine38-40 synthase
MKKFAVCLGYLPILSLMISAFKNARLINSRIDSAIQYASRTDRGVGAVNQVVSFDSKQDPILPEINSYLPDSIRVLGVTRVSSEFHARRDALSRTYSYFLVTKNPIDLSLTRKTLALLVGEHDFHNFSKRDGKKSKNTVKTIDSADIFPVGENTFQIRISSRSFLWQMARRIIGHLIELNDGKCNSQYTHDLLELKNVEFKPSPARPENLVLENVQYEEIKFQYNQKALHSFHRTLIEHLLAAKAKSALYDFMGTQLQEAMD